MPAATPQPLLDVRRLRAWFRTRGAPARAVDDLSFRVYPGETYALVGESGCGKSVTALSILQLLPRPNGYIAGGEILLEGRDLAGLPPAAMRRVRGNRVSMIFQEPMTALNPVFTVGQQVAEVLRLHQRLRPAAARRRAIDMFEQVGLPEPAARFDTYPHQLSGGMRQRVMIAMALACRPRLLIADEPTTALDVTIQAQILELMAALRRELGMAVLLITHNLGIVREYADRVGVMYGGRLVEEAPAARLFAAPAHPYTERLLRALPGRAQRGGRLETIEGLVPPATAISPGCRFHSRCPVRLPRCADEPPPAVARADGHTAACHLCAAGEAARSLPFQRQGGQDAVEPGAAPPSAAREDTRPPVPMPTSAPVPDGRACLDVTDLQLHFPIRRGLLRRVVGHVRAVDGVTLALRRGETLALVGESGCGKTTVGKSLIRLLQPTGGSVTFDGVALHGLSRRQLKPLRRRIQFVFQDPYSSLDPRLTAGEIIGEGLEIHGLGATPAERTRRVRDLLARVGLDPDLSERYPHEFSGGQRQRVALARALAVEPELLICDEATSALDVSVQAQILNLLKELQRDFGLSYLFITHDLGVVEYLADRVAVMYLGRIVEEGACAEILETPRHPYTQALLSAVPQAGGAPRRKEVLAGDVPSPSHPPAGCHFHPRCPRALPACRAEYPPVSRFTPTHTARCHLWPQGLLTVSESSLHAR